MPEEFINIFSFSTSDVHFVLRDEIIMPHFHHMIIYSVGSIDF